MTTMSVKIRLCEGIPNTYPCLDKVPILGGEGAEGVHLFVDGPMILRERNMYSETEEQELPNDKNNLLKKQK